jgi:ATP-dependent DNA helicase RecQ
VEAVGTEPAAVAEHSGLGRRKAGRLLNLVELARQAHDGPPEELDVVARVVELAESHRNLERSRVEMMRTYAETDRCRSEFLVGYFGEELEERCGVCDNCRAGVAPDPADEPESSYSVQDHVHHQTFGAGVVTDIEEDRVTVLFDEVGYRTLDLELAEEGRLEQAP